MRIHLLLSNKYPIHKNYQAMLVGKLSEWTSGKFHNELSLYSISTLIGKFHKINKEKIYYPNNVKWFISFPDQYIDLVKKLSFEIIPNNYRIGINGELVVEKIEIEPTPLFGDVEKFYSTPILIKRTIDDRTIHFTYNQKISNDYLTKTLKSKIKKANLKDDNIDIKFDISDKSYYKTMYYKKIGNKVNICPIILTGNPSLISFAWNVGIGNSTGIGFGAIYK